MCAEQPSTSRRRRPLATVGLVVGALAVVACAVWWFGPWSAAFRYRRTDLVSLRRIVDEQPGNFAAWREIGLRLARDGDGVMAEPALRQAFALNPTDPEVATGLGELLFVSRRYGDAFQVLTAATNHNPDYVLAHMALGRVYRVKGSFQNAIREFEAVVKKDPSFSDAWYELTTCYLYTEQRQKARDAIARALQSNPDEPSYLALKGRVDAKAGRIDEAVEGTARAAKLAPRNLKIQITYASLLIAHYRNVQDLDRAEEVVRHCEELSPSDSLLPYLRGQIERLRGNWPAAVRHLEAAVRAAPNQNEVYFALGQAYRHLGRNQEADKTLAVYRQRDELDRQASAIANRIGAGETRDMKLRARLIDLYLKLGNEAAARATLEDAVQIDPKAAVLQPFVRALMPQGQTAGGPRP